MKKLLSFLTLVASLCGPSAWSAPATLLFEDNFDRVITGWTAVQPPGNYIDGPMRWQWDRVAQAWTENSNIYTDNATASPSATAVMLINDAVVGETYTYRTRMVAGDDDAFGLVWGFQDALNQYRITFARQNRGTGEANGYPFAGWHVDRKVEGAAVRLFGAGLPGFTPSFINRANIPFDVTITMAADRKLTITVVDDPDGSTPVTHTLVDNQTLPSSAAGKVGILSWGQASGNPSGFYVRNMELTPTALVNYPVPDVLTEWTEEIGARSDGSSNIGGQGHGNWSLGLGVNGPLGVLLENADTAPGNDAAGQLDFISSMLVAGDVNWTDYVMSTRLIPSDDDGFGVVVRFKDNRNYYRVGLRRQASANGQRPGLSIQKTVNGVWSEIYHDDPVRFNAPANVPFDLFVAVNGNQMQVLIVAPTQSYFYGPFDIIDGTVDNGKVGFYSWAMNTFRADSVQVHSIQGVPLIISSPIPAVTPAAGVHSYTAGSSVTVSAQSPFVESENVRHTVTGWTGTGDVPATGTESSATFTLNSISSIIWSWATEYRVVVTAGNGGTVNAPPNEWVARGTPLTFTATANPGFIFTGWTGTSSSRNSELTIPLNAPVVMQAQFASDTDNDGLPDEWEIAHFGNLSSGATNDPDEDLRDNLTEFRRGTSPNHRETFLLSSRLRSRWLNAQRDPALPGMLIVRDFGNGFRGVWENSNDYQEATTNPFLPPEQRVANVSFEGPRMIVTPALWQWNDFTATVIFSVGDNDGNCVYFRYRDENNWYRVTFNGNDPAAGWRAPMGASVQKRSNGVFTELGRDQIIFPDPADVAGFKKFRITVSARGADFTVRVTGWNVYVDPPNWDTSVEAFIQFSDPDHATGTFGVGTWGQGGGATATPTNPVDAGTLIQEVVAITTTSPKGPETEVFREDWSNIPLAAEIPAGWTTPFAGNLAGNWVASAHHSFIQTTDASTPSAGSAVADGEGPILLAPTVNSANYFLEQGFHPFDNDGIGFVYNFQDNDNYSRVIFVNQASGAGRLPPGLSVSRKSGGAWSNVISGDTTFVYTPGAPFHVEFSSNNGQYQLRAWNVDNPAAIQTWAWNGPASAPSQRFGPAAWQMTDAHFTHTRAYSLPAPPDGGELRITGFTVSGGNLTLNIVNTTGGPYTVQRATALGPNADWGPAGGTQTQDSWTGPVPASGNAFWRLVSAR